MIRLAELERCFQGVIPATIATCSPEGIPNITYLSIVHRVDDDHLALSFQFFNKTRENVLANPRAQIMVPDPGTFVQYRIEACFERTERDGPTFDRMRTHLAAVASQVGMEDVFRLQGADIYRVISIEALAHDLDLSPPGDHANLVSALASLSTQLADCDELETLLDLTLAGLATRFDYPHSMILIADDTGKRLHMVASRGFERSGVGAEVEVGEGIIGTAALERRPVRVTNMFREQILAEAVRTTARQQGVPVALQREIPLPGVADAQSQAAVPILARDRLLGVLAVQSPEPGRLTMDDELTLSTLARYLATSIQLLGQGTTGEVTAPQVYPARPTDPNPMRIRYHASDDSIFIDDEYLIKGLPGRILLRLLDVYERDGRIDFTNKELRLDASLRLGGYRDNLEARLLLLRRRLDERTPALRLTRTGRGRVRLELGRPFALIRSP